MGNTIRSFGFWIMNSALPFIGRNIKNGTVWIFTLMKSNPAATGLFFSFLGAFFTRYVWTSVLIGAVCLMLVTNSTGTVMNHLKKVAAWFFSSLFKAMTGGYGKPLAWIIGGGALIVVGLYGGNGTNETLIGLGWLVVVGGGLIFPLAKHSRK